MSPEFSGTAKWFCSGETNKETNKENSKMMIKKFLVTAALISLCLQPIASVAQVLEWEVGLTADRNVIHAQGVAASSQPARTVLYLAGMQGESASSGQLRSMLAQYAQLEAGSRHVNLIVIPVANPDAEVLAFPPQGAAYAENPVSHALWRWIGVHAPDLLVLADADQSGFAEALQNQSVAGVGSIPVQQFTAATTTEDYLAGLSSLMNSSASDEIERRLARTPRQLAEQLAQTYGYDFSTPAYVPGMSLIGRMRLGYTDEVEDLLDQHLAGDGIEVNNASVMAGQLVFAEHMEHTGDLRSQRLVVAAANLAFDERGNMRQAMPMHNEMSDSVFMAAPLLVKAGKFSADSRYFDMAARHVQYMQNLLLRDDGLYRHTPLADAAWGRGNAFPALGLALVLSDFPRQHPAYDQLRQAYLAHLQSLLPHQDVDGMWHEVIDYPGSFAELTSTAMIGIAIKRGIDRDWLDSETYQPVLNRIWNAVSRRTSLNGEFIDVCTSTGKMPSLDAYLDRLAIFGRDDRAGGMMMNFAIEMAGNI